MVALVGGVAESAPCPRDNRRVLRAGGHAGRRAGGALW